jgi:hypothetical protein
MPNFAIGMISSGNIIVSSAPASVAVPTSRVNLSTVVSVVSSVQSIPPTLQSQYPTVIEGNIIIVSVVVLNFCLFAGIQGTESVIIISLLASAGVLMRSYSAGYHVLITS